MIDRCYYVYVHRRATDGSIFYVGKGKSNRAYVAYGRNKHWKNVVAKHGYEIEIVAGFLSTHCACSVEKILIQSIGLENLTNMTSGGDGMLSPTDEIRSQMSKRAKERGVSEKLRIAGRTARTGKKNSQKQIDAVVKHKSKPIIASDGRIFPSATEAARVLASEMGRYISQGNISLAATGKSETRNNAYGLAWSYNLSEVPTYIKFNNGRKLTKITETQQIFKSTKDAAAWVATWRGSANHQCITQAARNGGKAYGYHWEYVE